MNHDYNATWENKTVTLMASEVQAQIIYKLYYKKSLQSAIKAHFDRRLADA